MSDDPGLREEMEKEVGSTNSAVVAAAAGWARSVSHYLNFEIYEGNISI